MTTLRKFYAVCESGNTDADTVVPCQDRETAQLFCDIWQASHPGANACVRDIRHMQHPEFGLVRMTVETY